MKELKISKKNTLKKGDLLMVEWSDAFSQFGWIPKDSPPVGCMEVVTIGFFVSLDKDALEIAPHLSEACRGDSFAVPTGFIKSIYRIAYPLRKQVEEMWR